MIKPPESVTRAARRRLPELVHAGISARGQLITGVWRPIRSERQDAVQILGTGFARTPTEEISATADHLRAHSVLFHVRSLYIAIQ